MRILLVLSLVACGGSGTTGGGGGNPDAPGGGGGDGGGGGGGDGGGGGGGDGGGGGGFRLIESSFTLAPDGDEKWQCERKTLTEDVWISRFTPIAPQGTHHTLLAIDTNPDADGTTACDVSIEQDWNVLFASGLGSPPINMPEGVAVHLRAGQQIVLDLHLYNFSSSPLAETSAIDVLTVDPGSVTDEAEVVLVGNVSFNVTGPGLRMVDGRCSIDANTNFFAVFPHMHQLGHHALVEVDSGGSAQTVYDEDYDFEQQFFREVPPIPVGAGDEIRITCTYDIPDSRTVGFGESSDEEMCFAISYLYPPTGPGIGNFCIF